MKKLLALVLALVMSMSLVTISNADFKDADEISYKEAVEVMNAVGVIAGYDNGNFGAKDTLTRAQAAKIVAYLDLGQKVADAISASGTVFTDVPATAWYAGYVEYCAGAGYVAGVGNGKFDPDAKVTGIQFAKMLLGALGYKADVEGYTGGDYSLNIARDANKVDLFDGLKIVTSAALTREQAAQMAFNALKADTVQYEGGTNITTADGTKVVINAVRKTNPSATGVNYNNSTDTDNNTEQLCEKLYGKDIKLSSGDSDAFGRPANKWTYDSKTVGTYAKSPVLTYTDVVKEKDLFSDLGVDGYSGSSSKYVLVTLAKEDGTTAFTASQTSGTYTVTAGDWYQTTADETAVIAKGDSSKIAGTGKGTITEVYEGDKDNEIILVFVNQYITKVTGTVKADADKGEGRKIKTGMGNFETDNFAKGDYVLVTKAKSEIKSAVKAEVLENVAVSSYTSDSVTVNGTTYKYSNRADTIEDKGSYKMKSGDTYTFYLDSCGYIIKGEVYSASSSDYYMIYDMTATYKQGDFTSDDKYFIYKVVDTNAATSTVKVVDEDDTADFAKFDVITMSEDDDNDGFMKFKKVANYSSSDKDTAGFKPANSISSFSNTSATLGNGISVNNSTTFVIQYETGKFKVVNGLNNMDNYSSLTTNPYCIVKNDVALVVFMNTIGKSASTSSDELVYVVDSKATVSYDAANKKTVYTYKAIVDGKDTTVATLLSSVSVGLNKVTSTENGYVKEMSAVTISTDTNKTVYLKQELTNKAEVSFKDGILKVDTTSYVVADDVVVYTVDGDDVVVVDADIEAVTGDEVKGTFYLIRVNITGDNTIETIYFDGTIG